MCVFPNLYVFYTLTNDTYILVCLDWTAWGAEPRGQRARHAAHEAPQDAVARRACLRRQVQQVQGQVRHMEPESQG